MTIRLNVPSKAEETLRTAWGEQLDDAALDALLIDGYRTGKLSSGDIADALGFETRFQAEQWLASRGVGLNYALEDFEADVATLDRVLGPIPR